MPVSIPQHLATEYLAFTTDLTHHAHQANLPQPVLDALPAWGDDWELSNPMLQKYTQAALLMWQKVLRTKHQGVLNSFECPPWLTFFVELSDKDISSAIYKREKGQALFRKIEKLQSTASPSTGAVATDARETLSALKFTYNPSVEVTTTGHLLRSIRTDYRYLGSDIYRQMNRVLWEVFGKTIASRYAEITGPMKSGVADAEELERRAGYELLARLLVNFAGFKKAPTAEALGVSRPWIENLLRG